MGTIGLGLLAALCWGLHDITIRYLSRTVPLMGALFFVLAAGLVFQMLVLGATDVMRLPQGDALWLSIGSGAAFLVASLGLYYAFERGPVRLVSPIIGAYPIVSLGLAALTGAVITPGQIAAVLFIIAGVGVVAALADTSGDPVPAKGPTIVLSLLSALGFALTFKLGQTAAELDGELHATMMARITALGLLAALIVIRKAPIAVGRRAILPLLIMGALDGVALLAVLTAGRLEHPQFAAVGSSMFGLFTIILAWALLKERMTAPQWGGCVVAFLGIGYLAL
ncbi:DMT family transporter [Tropicibacter alexandrii]|uniref:DMT family transporter n=1 Tax=Tropicibacter alexandrii TaxID=2267683 RepID=UPI000EF533A4|nr:DMT family transporter [Tropicibacter alexandrii]